jgi:predicted metalloprotease with PDZ domain
MRFPRSIPASIFILLFSTLTDTGSLGAAPLELQYQLRVTRPTTHLVEVGITASAVAETSLDFVMPAWAPGRYAIYDFAKNVQEFSAAGIQGQPLNWKKLDKQTWRVDTRQAGGTVKVYYRVFGNDLTGSFSQIDSSHASISGPSVFMYVDGHKPDPITLSVDAPPSWKLISGFSDSETERTFRANNYDILIDTPLEISPTVTTAQFVERGKTIRVAVHSLTEPNPDLTNLVSSVRKFVSSQLEMMPDPDFPHFTFIFHFAPGVPLGDGMEHLNSTSIVARNPLSSGGLEEVLEIACHEFFHVWNVKRLRPAGFGPFDYTREQYTNALWFGEGVTTYYSFVYLLRSGVWTREPFLARLAEEVRALEFEPGQKQMSAESASFHAWFYDRSPQMQQTNFANTTINYYNKGTVLGFLLDIEIRARTGGRKSLDDVIIAMYRKFYEAPPESYYLPGRGYRDEDILNTVNEITATDFKEFFDRYIRGTEPLPYNPVLSAAGLQLRIGTAPDAAPSLGVLTVRVPGGLRIMAVRPASAAERGGLSRDDILTAVDELSLETVDLQDRLRIYPPKTEVPLTVERRGRASRIVVVLDPPIPTRYSLEVLTQPTPEQLAVRAGWLGKPK